MNREIGRVDINLVFIRAKWERQRGGSFSCKRQILSKPCRGRFRVPLQHE